MLKLWSILTVFFLTFTQRGYNFATAFPLLDPIEHETVGALFDSEKNEIASPMAGWEDNWAVEVLWQVAGDDNQIQEVWGPSRIDPSDFFEGLTVQMDDTHGMSLYRYKDGTAHFIYYFADPAEAITFAKRCRAAKVVTT